MSPPLRETLSTLFPATGREDLAQVRTDVLDAHKSLAPGLPATESARLIALLGALLDTLPGQVADGRGDQVVATLAWGFEEGLGLLDRNLTRFWELKLEADRDDGAAMPDDVHQIETYDRNARLGSSLASVCARGMAAFLEHGDTAQRRAAHAWFNKAYQDAIKVAGGAPVLRPDADTPPARIIATGHAGKLAEALDAAAQRETDPGLKARMTATVESFRNAPGKN